MRYSTNTLRQSLNCEPIEGMLSRKEYNFANLMDKIKNEEIILTFIWI